MDVKAVVSQSVDASVASRAEGLEIASRGAGKDISKIKQLATDFEAMFMEQMLKGMRSSIQKSGLIDGGNAEEIYTSMLDSEYAKTMANQRNTGLADMIERQLLESMGVKSDISKAKSSSEGVRAYASASAATLQDTGKTVTIKGEPVPTIKTAR